MFKKEEKSKKEGKKEGKKGERKIILGSLYGKFIFNVYL